MGNRWVKSRLKSLSCVFSFCICVFLLRVCLSRSSIFPPSFFLCYNYGISNFRLSRFDLINKALHRIILNFILDLIDISTFILLIFCPPSIRGGGGDISNSYFCLFGIFIVIQTSFKTILIKLT